MMRHFKNKKIILAFLALLLILGSIWFYNEVQDPAPPILRAIYPHFQIDKFADDPYHYSFGNYDGFEFDFYAKEVVVGNVSFFLTVENKPHNRSIYRFYAIGLEPESVIETEWGLLVASSDEAFEENIFYDDITDDGIDEIFIRTRSEEGHLGYTIYREWQGSLRPIALDANYGDWINVKYLGHENDGVYFVTATSDDLENETYDETHKQKYYLRGDFLVSESEVERLNQANDFNVDLAYAMEDPKWAPFAKAFRDSCETLPQSVLNGKGLPFRAMIEDMDPVTTLPNGSKVYIVPCMLHAYQTSEMPVIFDGDTYEPIKINEMDYDNNRSESYTTVGLYYDPTQDDFTTYYKGRGMGDCGSSSVFKLVGKELVLQKMEADKECDGEYEREVIFDINVQ
jgi:hypothetical protein